jgi:hypothetical protein
MTPFAELLERAWPIFREAIRMRRTLTYSELAGRVGPPLTARAVHRQLLNPLSTRCKRWGLPDLPALVVRKGSGLPGGGWFDPNQPGDPLNSWVEAVARCYSHRWPSRPDPRLLVDLDESDRSPKNDERSR